MTTEDLFRENQHFYDANIMDLRYAERDRQIIESRIEQYNKQQGPRVGDFLKLPNGEYHRFSHHWGDGLQTSKDGSFYFGNGYVSFSGSLDPSIKLSRIVPTEETKLGRVWIFSQDSMGAGRAVYAKVAFRVFELR